MPKNINIKNVLSHFGKNPKCYLTGRKIDLTKTSSYHFDHIIPRTKGGENTLENLGLLCKDANIAKYNKTSEEFISLCREILENNGYKITKTAQPGDDPGIS